MTTTLLPKKASNENPFATNDTTHQQLVEDPHVEQFPTDRQSNKESIDSKPVLSNSNDAGTNAAMDATVLVKNDNKEWINKKWRPAMGWIYMVTCTADFVVFPILWSILQAVDSGNVTSQWQPLTLQGAGLYHLSMGAVLGIAAYGRTKEKIEGITK